MPTSPALTRRQLLASAGTTFGAGLGSTLLTGSEAVSAEVKPSSSFKYCFNTSTIRGQNLTITEEIDIAAKAGYDAIEPWLRKLDPYVKSGGSLKDLDKRIKDHGMTVESAIGFAQWIVDDDEKRAAGLEQAKRDMDTLSQISAVRIAAPPTGATKQTDLNLLEAAKRYRALLELGDEMGVIPQVEVWGFSKSLSRLGESVFVAIEAGHPKACLLPDVYHIYKGGSDFAGLKMLSAAGVQVFHVNDYPTSIPHAEINDSHRVYPGDGDAPLDDIFGMLDANGFQGYLSLELFNPEYWKQDPLEVAKTGLEKTKAAVAKAIS